MFLEEIKKRVLVLDGAMGTSLQALDLSDEVYEGNIGCPEILNVTVPEKLKGIHRSYLEAGADIVETNTFGGSPITLDEYDLGFRCEELNLAAARLAREVADEFSTPERPRFVAGAFGPGTKLATLGQISFDTLFEGY
ncbi:homocysteine S-methyltransferase family protein, partial [bacterium]|nr:homocysteine S-methyltransferase family protein [bacterium]